MKKLLFLFFTVLLTGCATVVPEKNYTGMTKKQIFDELSKKGAVYIGYNVSRDKMFSNGGRRFESWQKLENDKLYFNMRQWRINTQDKRIFGKHYIRETVLTFHLGKVVKQELDEWTYPPSDEYCAKVERFTSPQGKVLRPLLESEPMPRILPEVDIDRLKKDSGKGDEKAIIKLAICYAFGHQVPENFEEAERLLKSIAGKGNVDGIADGDILGIAFRTILRHGHRIAPNADPALILCHVFSSSYFFRNQPRPLGPAWPDCFCSSL